MRQCKFLAFSVPIKMFFKLPGLVSVYWKDQEGQYYGSNDILANMGNISVNRILGKTDYDIVTHLADADIFRKHDAKIIKIRQTQVFVETGKFKNKQNITCLSIKTPLETTVGHIAGTFGLSFFLSDPEAFNQVANFSHLLFNFNNLNAIIQEKFEVKKPLSPREMEC